MLHNEYKLDVYSTIGRRPIQEDYYVAQPVSLGFLLGVCDGHGIGLVSGHVAARLPLYVDQGLSRELPIQKKADEAQFQAIREEMSDADTKAALEAHPGYAVARERQEDDEIFPVYDSVPATEDDIRGNYAYSRLGELRRERQDTDPLYEIHDALRDTVAQLIEDMRGKKEIGTTLSLAYIRVVDDKLHVHTAQLGDSMILIQPPDGELITTAAHNAATHEADRAEIQRRLEAIGESGDIPPDLSWGSLSDSRVWAGVTMGSSRGLSVTRAIGDTMWDGLLIREPELTDHIVPLDSLVVGVTDGVLVGDAAKGGKPEWIYREITQHLLAGESAQAIGQSLLEREGSGDNLTIVAYRQAEDDRPVDLEVDVWTAPNRDHYVLLADLPDEMRKRIEAITFFVPIIGIHGGDHVTHIAHVDGQARACRLKLALRYHDHPHKEDDP
ncbi:hypothetical protein [Thiohalobacter thiocyanaticus]|uniref:hypothetical protein n=1 Tax=Thiohalobacter thiocyanaticus TaxID=585455 RepID=UPI000BBA4C32|nr:hypothetical protein [Thiohalobacter thiocyanaticus]